MGWPHTPTSQINDRYRTKAMKLVAIILTLNQAQAQEAVTLPREVQQRLVRSNSSSCYVNFGYRAEALAIGISSRERIN